ncbi:MAG: hypothetical protein Q8R37_00225 [Nanoarchaeota archaeon]|nr:hypothetical protein [Nanoarchaeota archaeon]
MNNVFKTVIGGLSSLALGCAAVPANHGNDAVKEKAQHVAKYVIQHDIAHPAYENLPPELSDAIVRSARTYSHAQELEKKSYFANIFTVDAAIHGLHIIVMESDDGKNAHLVSVLDTFVDGSCDNGVMMWRKDSVNGPLMEYSTGRDLGVEHKDTFQGMYETILDTLLSAYEKPQEKK